MSENPVLRVFTGQTLFGRLFAKTRNGFAWTAELVDGDHQGKTAEAGTLLDAAYRLLKAADEEHNGHANIETWQVRLHLEATKGRRLRAKDAARKGGADGLKDHVEDMLYGTEELPLMGIDLLGCALARVDWKAIAEYLLEG